VTGIGRFSLGDSVVGVRGSIEYDEMDYAVVPESGKNRRNGAFGKARN